MQTAEGVTISRTPTAATARWRWRGGHEAQFFVIGFTCFLMPLLMKLFEDEIAVPLEHEVRVFMTVVFLLVGGGCLGASLLAYINSTELQVSADSITVRNTPLYPFPAKSFPMRLIQRVWIEVTESRLNSGRPRPPSFGRGTVSLAKSVVVRAATLNGETITIATGLRSEAAGEAVAELIASFLPC